MKQKISLQDCIKYADIHGGKCISHEYKNNYTKLLWQCKNKHMWASNFHNMKDQQLWCRKCSHIELTNKKRLTLNDCIKYAMKNGGLCLSKTYVNNITKMSWKCAKNHIWVASFSNLKNKSKWCRECSIEGRRLGIEACQKYAISKNGQCLSIIYKNNLTKLYWKCKDQHEWLACFADIKCHGSWCPICSIFKNEKLVGKALDTLNIPAKAQVRINDIISSVRNYVVVDYFFNYNENKYIIEYNGEQHYKYISYFHKTKSEFMEQQTRDIDLYNYCKLNGINLITIDGRKIKDNGILKYIKNILIIKE